MIELSSARLRVVAREEKGLAVVAITDLGTGQPMLASAWYLAFDGAEMSGWVLRWRDISSAAASLNLGTFRLDRWLEITDRVVKTRTTLHNVGEAPSTARFGEEFTFLEAREVHVATPDRVGWQGELAPSHSVSWEFAVDVFPEEAG